MCMYIVHVHVYVYVNSYIYTCHVTPEFTCVHVHVYVNIHIHACTYTCTCTCTYKCTCTCMRHVTLNMYMPMYMYMYMARHIGAQSVPTYHVICICICRYTCPACAGLRGTRTRVHYALRPLRRHDGAPGTRPPARTRYGLTTPRDGATRKLRGRAYLDGAQHLDAEPDCCPQGKAPPGTAAAQL